MLIKCADNVFEGFLDVNNVSYYILLKVPKFPNLENMALTTEWKIHHILRTNTAKLKLSTALNKSKTLDEFLEKLKRIIQVESKSSNDLQIMSAEFYEDTYKDIRSLQSSRMDVSLDNEWHTVKLTYRDFRQRSHKLEISLPNNSILKPQVKHHQLPLRKSIVFEPHLDFTGVSTVESIGERFIQLIDTFCQFWDLMDTLDSNCWILEPLHPIYSDTFRRIKITDEVSVLLTFNPYNVMQRPEIDFRGSETDIHQFRQRLQKGLLSEMWDPEVDVHLNLLSVLELEDLPMKPDNLELPKDLIQVGECVICFEARLENGDLPQNRCDNLRCDAQFHHKCLLKYLYMDLKNTRIGQMILGTCPTCRENIACSIN